MRVSRVYLPQSLVSGDSILVENEQAHYILTVLRLKAGFSLVVFNGEGGQYQATITALGPKKTLTLAIGQFQPINYESPLLTSLALGISRGERMDYAIQKAVELGVSQIIPLFTEYCVIKLNTLQAQRRLRHWQRIAEHACEQCGRTVVPQVDMPTNLSDWLQQSLQGCKLLFHPDQSQTLDQIEFDNQHIQLLIGPEGGFSKTEYRQAVKSEFQPVSIGMRILRSETAVVAALTSIQRQWGDM